MRFIKTLEQFLISEALKDDIPKHLSDIISTRSTEGKYLDVDVPEHTDKIPNIKIEVKDEKLTKKSINEIVEYFTNNIVEQFKKSEIFKLISSDKVFDKSLNASLDIEKFNKIDFDYITKLYSTHFRLFDNKSSVDNIIFSNNKSNIYGFIKSYNKIIKNDSFKNIGLEEINYDIISDKVFNGLRDVVNNYEKNIEKIKSNKLYLYITDKPTDKLLMSVSKFYSSCQNFYSGTKNHKLLSNVFDPNTKIALLIFDTPYIDQKNNSVPYTSISRCLIRYDIVSDKIMFDTTYPSDMKSVMYNIITEYTGLENQGKSGDIYHYTGKVGLHRPYMDTYTIKNHSNIFDNLSPNMLASVEYLKKSFKNFKLEDMEILSDNEFVYDDTEYNVYTNQDVRDMFDNWLFSDTYYENLPYYTFDLFNNKKVKTLLKLGVINLENIIKYTHKDIEKPTEKQFFKWLSDNNVETIGDMLYVSDFYFDMIDFNLNTENMTLFKNQLFKFYIELLDLSKLNYKDEKFYIKQSETD